MLPGRLAGAPSRARHPPAPADSDSLFSFKSMLIDVMKCSGLQRHAPAPCACSCSAPRSARTAAAAAALGAGGACAICAPGPGTNTAERSVPLDAMLKRACASESLIAAELIVDGYCRSFCYKCRLVQVHAPRFVDWVRAPHTRRQKGTKGLLAVSCSRRFRFTGCTTCAAHG